MPSTTHLEAWYEALHRDAQRLAGGLTDLAQRATVYHHLFAHSGRNHIFPLIAAHGAMWARGWFRFGMKLGWCCSWQYVHSRETRRKRLAQLTAFADAFRDINRRVCVETYTTYHFTARFGDHPDAGQFVPSEMLRALNRCHAARRNGRELSTGAKRDVFEAFFLDEQQRVVGPQIEQATSAFDWPLMKRLALRPVIRFAYLPRPLFFRNFADRAERIEKGLRAFDLAAAVGWAQVESALRSYALLPDAFFTDNLRHFAAVREMVLAG
jgi:hypothetical protein